MSAEFTPASVDARNVDPADWASTVNAAIAEDPAAVRAAQNFGPDAGSMREWIAKPLGPFDNEDQAIRGGVSQGDPYRGSDGQIHWLNTGTDPLTLSGVVAAFDLSKPGTIFSDAGSTQAVDGDTIYRITDANGGALYLEQSSAGARWTLDGSTMLSPASPVGYAVSGSGVPLDWRSCTVIAVFGQRNGYDKPAHSGVIAMDATYGVWSAFSVLLAKNSATTSGAGAVTDEASCFTGVACGASGITCVTNQQSITGPAYAATGSLNYAKVLVRSTDTFGPMKRPIKALYFFNRALTQAELESVRDYFGAVSKPVIVQCVGDSLSSGEHASAVQKYWTNQIAKDRDWAVIPSGVQSMLASGILTYAPQLVTGYTAGKTNIAVIWAGYNDFKGGSVSPESMSATILSICSAFQSAGYITLVCTWPACKATGITPPSGYEGQTFNQTRAVVNGLIRANYVGSADGVVDLGADSIMGNDDTPDNTTYYNSDKLHFADGGETRIAEVIQAAIDAVIE